MTPYNFYSGEKYGYIAFLHQKKTGYWIVKSLKLNDKPDNSGLLLAKKLKEAGWGSDEKKGGPDE